MKRYLLQFQPFGFILKVSLEKTLFTITQNPICIKNYGNGFKAKDVSRRDIFSINLEFSIVYGNCGKCLLKRHFQYQPILKKKIMEGVSSRDTFSIISFFRNCGRYLFKIRSIIFKKLGLY